MCFSNSQIQLEVDSFLRVKTYKLKCIVLPLPGIIKNPGFVSPLTETSRCNNAFISHPKLLLFAIIVSLL